MKLLAQVVKHDSDNTICKSDLHINSESTATELACFIIGVVSTMQHDEVVEILVKEYF